MLVAVGTANLNVIYNALPEVSFIMLFTVGILNWQHCSLSRDGKSVRVNWKKAFVQLWFLTYCLIWASKKIFNQPSTATSSDYLLRLYRSLGTEMLFVFIIWLNMPFHNLLPQLLVTAFNDILVALISFLATAFKNACYNLSCQNSFGLKATTFYFSKLI